jgi:hypothetical protein
MFCKHLLVYINSKVPFHENLPPLPSHRSGVPGYRHARFWTRKICSCVRPPKKTWQVFKKYFGFGKQKADLAWDKCWTTFRPRQQQNLSRIEKLVDCTHEKVNLSTKTCSGLCIAMCLCINTSQVNRGAPPCWNFVSEFRGHREGGGGGWGHWIKFNTGTVHFLRIINNRLLFLLKETRKKPQVSKSFKNVTWQTKKHDKNWYRCILVWCGKGGKMAEVTRQHALPWSLIYFTTNCRLRLKYFCL